MVHSEALELIAAASRILTATALLHTTRPGAARRTMLDTLHNDSLTASNNLYRIRDLSREIE